MSANDTDSDTETDGGDSFGRRRHRPHHDNPMEVFHGDHDSDET
ncbi:hypothetical protein DF3PB_670005 [uncultured Defluviicoccus sp.]|uniref:Uncharacterized protein n=1 Tax=metagenome TaxID=256318 RepID=A0A380TL60_9ZZZZ|nr:hypothetical protein DF3PB_670005 [uncultured Defluviicoccus sp.]